MTRHVARYGAIQVVWLVFRQWLVACWLSIGPASCSTRPAATSTCAWLVTSTGMASARPLACSTSLHAACNPSSSVGAAPALNLERTTHGLAGRLRFFSCNRIAIHVLDGKLRCFRRTHPGARRIPERGVGLGHVRFCQFMGKRSPIRKRLMLTRHSLIVVAACT